MLLIIFTSDLEDGIKCTLTKFVHGPKLTKERRSTLQEDLDCLEEWARKPSIEGGPLIP